LEVAVFRLDCIPVRDSLEEAEEKKPRPLCETTKRRKSGGKKFLVAVPPFFRSLTRQEAGAGKFA
jgi:hypothetical protein